MTTPENIDSLENGQIFVFGSNILGQHLGGAAKLAHEKFGAEWGIGEGLTGQCYAFPTLNEKMKKRTKKELQISALKLKNRAVENPDKQFMLTRVGCGIAGYDEQEMIDLFKDSPKNLIKPSGW